MTKTVFVAKLFALMLRFYIFLLLIVNLHSACFAANPKSHSCSYYLTNPLDFKFKGEGLTVTNAKEWLKLYYSPTYQEEKFFDTTLYFTPKKNQLPGFLGVSRNSKAVVIALGGSGTDLSSGRQMMKEASPLLKYNIDLVSFDYPFHANGPTERRYYNIDFAVDRMARIVRYFKKSGKPIYLMGHSFGPVVIQELLYRFPDLAKGAFYFSPSSLSSKTLLRYQELMNSPTIRSSLEFKSEMNEAGIQFADGWAEQALSCKDVAQKTSVPVYIVAGNQDLWSSPSEIREIGENYLNASVTILDGVTHSEIFKYKQEGKSEHFMTALMAEAITKSTLIPEGIPENATERALFFYRNSSLFRDWISSVRLSVKTIEQTEQNAANILEEFKAFYSKYIYLKSLEQAARASPKEKAILENGVEKMTFPDLAVLLNFLH